MDKLKRLLVPKFWRVAKKQRKWVVSPRPGPHKKFEGIPLQIVVRNLLKLVETGSEAKKIISAGEIVVDGRKRKDHAYQVGLFDVISIPKIGKIYRVVPSESGLNLVEILELEAKQKIFRFEGNVILHH